MGILKAKWLSKNTIRDSDSQPSDMESKGDFHKCQKTFDSDHIHPRVRKLMKMTTFKSGFVINIY